MGTEGTGTAGEDGGAPEPPDAAGSPADGSPSDDTRRRAWFTEHPLMLLIVGAILATVGSVLGAGVQIRADAAAREDEQVEATRAQRLTAYADLLTVMEDGIFTLAAFQATEAADAPDAPMAATISDVYDVYRDEVLPAKVRVELVGSDELARLAGDMTDAFLLARDSEEELNELLVLIVRFRYAARDEVR